LPGRTARNCTGIEVERDVKLLIASRVGSFAADVIREGGSGVVTTARSEAAYVQMQSGPVLALLPAGSPIHPWALTVPFDMSTLSPGTRVRLGHGVIAIGTVLIPMSATRTIDLMLRIHPVELPIRAMRYILGFPLPESAGGLSGTTAPPCLADFRAGGRPEGLSRLFGLGSGLTPSGDDTLVGVLAALSFLSRAMESAADDRAELIICLAHDLDQGMTGFSAAMILAAIAGAYAEPVLDLLHEVGRESATTDSLGEACASLLAVGHDSGAAMLEGIRAVFARSLLATRLVL
jgi:hypothetical protein